MYDPITVYKNGSVKFKNDTPYDPTLDEMTRFNCDNIYLIKLLRNRFNDMKFYSEMGIQEWKSSDEWKDKWYYSPPKMDKDDLITVNKAYSKIHTDISIILDELKSLHYMLKQMERYEASVA